MTEKLIKNPINLIIEKWSKVLFSIEGHEHESKEIYHDVSSNIFPIYEILKMEQRNGYIFLHAVVDDGNDETYGYFRFYDARPSLELINMAERKNIYLEIDEIRNYSKERFFTDVTEGRFFRYNKRTVPLLYGISKPSEQRVAQIKEAFQRFAKELQTV